MRSVPFSPSHLVWTGAEGEISCFCRESISGCWRATRQTLIPGRDLSTALCADGYMTREPRTYLRARGRGT